jgi:protein BCP1
LEKVPKDSTAGSVLGRILSPKALAASTGHAGLIISERLINMPPQIMPPMYKMLGDELQNAIEQVWFTQFTSGTPQFDHLS